MTPWKRSWRLYLSHAFLHSLTHTLSLAHTLSLSLSHTHKHSLSLTYSLALSLSHKPSAGRRGLLDDAMEAKLAHPEADVSTHPAIAALLRILAFE